MVSDPAWTRDELILACDLVMENDWRQIRENDPRAEDLSSLLKSLPVHPKASRSEKFRSVGSVSRKTADLATIRPDYQGEHTRGSKLGREVLSDFLKAPDEMHLAAEAIRKVAMANEFVEPLPKANFDVVLIGDTEFREGGLLATRYFCRERDPRLRAEKIADFLATEDRVRCEVCGFDFEEVYGKHGAGYIECHHVVPLHVSGEKLNRASDVILLCPNCHRMIHYRQPWLRPEELRALLDENAGAPLAE